MTAVDMPPEHPARPQDDLDYRHAPGTRAEYVAHQRGAGLTALGRLLLHLPVLLINLGLVLLAGWGLQQWCGLPYGILPCLWLAAGLLTFHRPTEGLLARYLLGLHRPLPRELAVLGPVWREVTLRAGVDGSRYELWIEDSADLTAAAAGGHLVIVTRHALETLSTARLAAVLAHELGHHTAGHTWARLVSWWYALPGRLLWLVFRPVGRAARQTARQLPGPVAALLLISALWAAHGALTSPYGLLLGFGLLPFLTAWVDRRDELRADRHAAALGFGPVLAELLAEEPEPEESGTLRLLLSSRPPARTRLHRLVR
ncbi:M48 family metalloprotease [Streptomyces antimicrobicus]|uniref:M48 family metalloprotease n=1 Tax=Streptomyces antimicrobicus TaxID=2883108 RepID=A0ABS8B237_9ACTN|nr:M48 family metalloprotease [Streptomyces antimicrobicus]MCB5178653.1 M48 family metalloprotease [Streptomyces antimicrobicus]